MRFGAAKSLVFGFKLVENDAETKARSIERYVNNSGLDQQWRITTFVNQSGSELCIFEKASWIAASEPYKCTRRSFATHGVLFPIERVDNELNTTYARNQSRDYLLHIQMLEVGLNLYGHSTRQSITLRTQNTWCFATSVVQCFRKNAKATFTFWTSSHGRRFVRKVLFVTWGIAKSNSVYIHFPSFFGIKHLWCG